MAAVDAHLFRLLHAALSDGGPLLYLMAGLTILGSGWSMIAFVPLLAARRTRAFSSALVAVLVVTATLVFALKRVVGRARPCSCLEGVHALVFAAPTDFSFPSGHAAGSFAVAAFCAVALTRSTWSARARWLATAALFALALGVAASRLALGVHFPGDLAVGALLGASLGVAGGLLYLRRRAALAPAA